MSRIGIIGGTGLSQIAGFELIEKVSLGTDWGEPSSDYLCGKLANTDCVFLARHGDPHLIPPHKVNYRANIAGFESLGVRNLIAVNAVGGIHPDMGPEVVVIPDQLIDYSWGRAHTFSDDADSPLQHVDFTYPFSPMLRGKIINSARRSKIAVIEHGVYGVTQGPRLETAAEIKRLQRDGCDLVGMTAMPEASLAVEKGLEYASISLVVNWAAGLAEDEITMEQIHQSLASGMARVVRLLGEVLPGIA